MLQIPSKKVAKKSKPTQENSFSDIFLNLQKHRKKSTKSDSGSGFALFSNAGSPITQLGRANQLGSKTSSPALPKNRKSLMFSLKTPLNKNKTPGRPNVFENLFCELSKNSFEGGENGFWDKSYHIFKHTQSQRPTVWSTAHRDLKSYPILTQKSKTKIAPNPF